MYVSHRRLVLPLLRVLGYELVEQKSVSGLEDRLHPQLLSHGWREPLRRDGGDDEVKHRLEGRVAVHLGDDDKLTVRKLELKSKFVNLGYFCICIVQTDSHSKWGQKNDVT